MARQIGMRDETEKVYSKRKKVIHTAETTPAGSLQYHENKKVIGKGDDQAERRMAFRQFVSKNLQTPQPAAPTRSASDRELLSGFVRQTMPDAYRRTQTPMDAFVQNRLGESMGQYGKGNIDLYNRPQYRQRDGSISTVNSMSFGDETGKEILVPTIGSDAHGRPVQFTEDQAIDQYYKTGQYLGKFDSIDEADKYADRLHRQQEAYYDDSQLRALANQAPRPFEVGGAVRRFQQTGEMNITPELKKMMDEAPESGQGIRSSTQEEVNAAADWTKQRVENANKAQSDRELRTFDRHNPIIAGALQGTGIPSMLTAGEQALARLTGNEEAQKQSAQMYENELREAQGLQERHPYAFGAGSLAGNIGTMALGGELLGGAAEGIKAPKLAVRAITGGILFGGSTAAHQAGSLATGLMSGTEFARNVGVSTVSGAAQSAAAMATAVGLEDLLRRTGSQTLFLDWVKNLSSATAGAGTRIGIEYAMQNKTPTDLFRKNYMAMHPEATEEDLQKAYTDSLRQQAAVQFGTAFAMNLLSATMDTYKTNSRNFSWLKQQYEDLEKDIELAATMRPANSEDLDSWQEAINNRTQALRETLQGNYFGGQQDKVDAMTAALDAIDARAADFVAMQRGTNTFGASSGTGTASGTETALVPMDFAAAIDQAMKQGVAEAQAQPPAVPGMEQLRALAAPPTETAEAQLSSTDITTGAATAQRDIPGNPYARTAMQDLDQTARQIQAAQYERGQYPSVERLNEELNSPFAVFENESPEITALQSQAGAERLTALADARANQQTQLREAQRQALINSGVNQDSSYVPTTARQPLERFVNRLAEQDQTAQRAAQIDRRIAENTAAIEAIRAEARPSAVDSAQMNGYTQNIDTQDNLSREAIGYGTGEPESNLSGEGSRWPVSLSAGERNGSIPSAAGVPAESSWRAGKDAADPEAGTLRFTGEVPATQIFPEAEPGQVIHLVSSGTTPSVNKGGAVLKAAGAKKVTYYGSDNDIATIRGEQVRASVNLDTGEVNIRVNDPNTTAEQQSYHEAVEIGVGDGRIVVSDAMKHLKSSLMDMGIDAAGADEIITKVSGLYQQGNTTPEGMAHANKEMVCDGGARINQFDGVEGYEDAAAFMQVIGDILHPYCNDKLGGAFDAEAEGAPLATMEGVTPEQAKALETVNTVIDTKDGTANALPIQYSADLWNESQYVKERAKAIETICQNLNVSKEQAEKYIDDVNSVAKIIIADRGRYDYKNSGLSPFVSNAEYGGSFDFDTLCPKRGPFIGTFQAIQELLPNTALTRDEVLAIRKMMDDNGLEVPCGKCYVEGSRAAMGEFTKKFLELYKKYYPENWQPNMAQANTPDGIEWIRLTHPECYEQYEYFWNHYGTLKPGDPNLFASQQKPKLYMSHSAYSNEILREFKNKLTVIEKNRNGGIRFQSFSDCEIIHIIDAMQAIMDMSVVGLNGQGYTKQPNFAAAFGDTGLKINLSIDAWGFDEDGKLIFNGKEGMPFETAMELRNKHSKNVGTICCVYDDKMLLAALADDRIDFIIPFHRSQWKKSQYKAMGLPSTTKDYTYQQNEKWLDPSKHTHEYRGRQVKTKCLNYMPNDYWDFSKSGKENAEKYLDMCYRDGKRPKFYKFLDKTMVDGKAKFSLKADGSTDGYWKLLIDFKMYDNDGVGSPQMPVRPNFDMQAIQRMFAEYAGDHHSYPVAKGIVDQFVADYKKKHPGIHYSSKLNLPGKKTVSGKKDSSGNELTVQQEEYFKDSKVRDEDGNLLVVYHGTSEDFTVFDRSKVRSNMDIQGSFFSPWDIDAEGYGPNVKTVYLNIKNPAPEGVAYKALNMFKGQNGAGIKAREYLISRGYDGVNNGDEEYIAFYPEQIKNIDNLAPTENEDIRYSSKLQLQQKRDEDYSAAIRDNDTKTAERLVKEAAEEAGYKLSVYHGTGETFTVFNRGAEGIHLGNRQQAEQVARTRFENRSKNSMYTWEKIRNRVPEMNREQRESLTKAAYFLGDYFEAGANEYPFDGNVMDDTAVTEYVDHMVEAYKKGTGSDNDVTLRMRTFDRETNENVMELYAKINNPMVINGDIVSWTPSDIADVIGARNKGTDKLKLWYKDNPVDISGSEINLSEDDKQNLEAIRRTNNDEGWPILRDILAGQGYDGIQYKNEYEGDKQSWSYIALNPSDVKSADTVTYDDNGNVIPLSERFNPENEDIRYSSKLDLSEYGPTFYSKLQREVENYKGEKIGAASVESYLKGKGVKDEEIKWSGIRTYLEGKKSVNKQDLMQYLRDNEMQIEEKILGGDVDQNVWSNGYNTVYTDRYYDPVSNAEFKGEDDFRKEAVKRAAEDRIQEKDIIFNISDDYMSAETEDGEVILEAMLPDVYELRDAEYEPSNGTRWEDYKLDGGKNYREVLFSIPGSDYSNQAMQTHWKGDKGVLAHARVQDFDSADGGKVLFVEEIQSDWHNAGQKNGYSNEFNVVEGEYGQWLLKDANGKTVAKTDQLYTKERAKEALMNQVRNKVAPDAPYRATYTDYVLKNLLRMAAEGNYDYLAWTTGKMQEERWSDEYAEGYRIEYDQQIPKFLKKYGKQWGAGLTEVTVGGNTVPAIVVNDAMKESVLTEGQPMYSTKLNLNGREVELTDREEELMDQLNTSYLDRIDEITRQKDAEIAALQEEMERTVGEEKKKARERLERLRKQKNDRIAYLEKQWRENTNRRIAELKKKAETKLGEQHDDMIRRLANLQAQKDKKIDEILAAHRAQKQAARDKRNDRKLRVKFQKLAQKALRESRNKPGLASERVQELLKDIDLTALGMTDTTRTSLHNKLLEIMEMRKTDENYLALHAEDDWKKVERLFKKQIKDMSLEEVSDMITELSALSHYQETTDRLLRDEQNRSAAEVGRQIVQDLKELTPLDVTNPVKVMSAKYLRDNLSPERAFNRLSGYKRDSAMKSLYRQVLDGYTRVKTFEKMSSELFERFEKDEKNKDFLKNGAKQTIPITSKYGQTALISPAMRVSLYMASKNRDNQRHIATDGMTVPEPSAYAKGLIEDAYGRGTTIILDPTDINKICADMTESEKEFASLLETFFDRYAKDAINETSVDLDGVLKAIVDNYFPISSDKNFLAKSMDNFQDPTLEGWNNLKKRQEGANNKILLEDARQVLKRHIRNTARYYGLAIPLRNWNKVYGYTSHRDEFTGTRNSVQSAIKNAWNSDTADYIERLIRDDINAGGRKAERGVLDAMRSAYAGSTLTLNASVALKQTTSYAMAGSILDTGSLMYGLAHKFTKADEQYMDSITPWGWARRQGQSTIELGEMAKKQDPITKNTPNLNQAMDVWTTNRLFLATEESVRKEFPDLHRGDKKYDETLAERYNQVLWRTQPQYEAAFRPEYLRKTDIGSRTFGMFKTESMQMSGELIDAWGQWKADEKRAKNGSETAAKYSEESAKNFYKTLASWTASNLTFALMGTALNILLFHKGKPYRNEKGEIDFETLLKKTGLNFISSAAGGFFGASSMVDFATYIYSALKGEKSQWYDIEAPGLSLINDLINNMGNMIGTMGNEEASTGAKAQAISKFALSVSKFTPIGFAENIVNLANSVVLYNQDLREGTMGRWEAGKGLLKDTSPTRDQYANMAVDAARKGDMEKAARALKKTKKTNLEKAVGRPITENMYKRINEDPNNLRSYLGVALEAKAPSIRNVPDHGYSSFTKLREDLGDPERTQNWHHIVEQEQMEKSLSGFTSTQVNNTNNIVSIPSGSKSPHAKISEYYGSVQDFTGGKTVREWLKGKSFEEQWEFGVKQLREYGDLVPTDSGWVFVPDKEKIESKIPMNEGTAKEKTDMQRTWESRIAEAREDGGVTRHEAGAVALEMLANGAATDEIKEFYKKTDKKVGEWKDGTFEDYLKGRDAVDAAKSIQDKDKTQQTEKRKKYMDDYLIKYKGTYDDELLLWKLAGFSESTFVYHE